MNPNQKNTLELGSGIRKAIEKGEISLEELKSVAQKMESRSNIRKKRGSALVL